MPAESSSKKRWTFYERLTGKIAIEALTPGALIMTKGFRNDGASETARAVGQRRRRDRRADRAGAVLRR